MNVEEFYNACHNKADGRFCGHTSSGYFPKGSTIVTRGGIRGESVGRYLHTGSKPHPGAVGGVKIQRGAVAAKATSAVQRGPAPKPTLKPATGKAKISNMINKDDGLPTPGSFKITGNRTHDMIEVTRFDRGSAERKAAATAFEKHYAKK